MAGQKTVYRFESWAYHDDTWGSRTPGKPTCYDTRWYQDKQKGLDYFGIGKPNAMYQVATSPPPYVPGNRSPHWIEITEFVANGSVDYYV